MVDIRTQVSQFTRLCRWAAVELLLINSLIILQLIVSVQMGGSHYCGGSLIAKDIVLTAAHCLSLASFQVVIGRTDISDANNGDQIAVKKMILHPDFDIDGTWESDFALLVLARPTTSTNAQVMELNMDDNYPSSGTIGTVMGWGDIKEQNNKFETSDVLMTVEAETLSNEECASAQGKLDGFKGTYEDWIFPSMICTLSKKQNACNGDSGEYLAHHANLLLLVPHFKVMHHAKGDRS